MIELLRKTLEALRKRTERNMEVIHQNNMIAQAMLEETLTDEQSEKIEARYQENKKLMKENSESIQLQYEITKFIENHFQNSGQKKREALGAYQVSAEKEQDTHSKQQILELTIRGEIPFNNKHPFFRDEEFFSQLLRHYQRTEQYETCQALLKQRRGWQGN
mgnify:FL=1